MPPETKSGSDEKEPKPAEEETECEELDPKDRETVDRLQVLRDVPERKPADIEAGRKQFLKEAENLDNKSPVDKKSST